MQQSLECQCEAFPFRSITILPPSPDVLACMTPPRLAADLSGILLRCSGRAEPTNGTSCRASVLMGPPQAAGKAEGRGRRSKAVSLRSVFLGDSLSALISLGFFVSFPFLCPLRHCSFTASTAGQRCRCCRNCQADEQENQCLCCIVRCWGSFTN
jgi:hypothetical protein